jgi:hypothetical protein
MRHFLMPLALACCLVGASRVNGQPFGPAPHDGRTPVPYPGDNRGSGPPRVLSPIEMMEPIPKPGDNRASSVDQFRFKSSLDVTRDAWQWPPVEPGAPQVQFPPPAIASEAARAIKYSNTPRGNFPISTIVALLIISILCVLARSRGRPSENGTSGNESAMHDFPSGHDCFSLADGVCPKCGYSFDWDGKKCGYCLGGGWRKEY